MRHHGEKSRTKHEEGELDIYTKENLLSFPTKVNINNNHNNNKKKTKQHLECNCWVCKILDSSSSSVIDKTTTAVTKRYEAYNLVSETGDSIFYDPLISSIFNNQEGEDKPRVGQIYIAEDRILDFVQDELAKKISTE